MGKIRIVALSIIAASAFTIPTITGAEAAPQSVWTNNAARNQIIRMESGGNPYAVNSSSGAMGLYQCMPSVHACPALGDVSAQHEWGNKYVLGRYGSWEAAWAFHKSNGWY